MNFTVVLLKIHRFGWMDFVSLDFISRATMDEILWFLFWMIDHFMLFDLVYYVDFLIACVGTGWGSHFRRFLIALFWGFMNASGSVCRLCPDFGMLGCFSVPIVVLVVILEYWIWSTGIVRCAEIPRFGRLEMARSAEISWFGRPNYFSLPNQTAEPNIDLSFPRRFWFLNISK